MRKTIYLLRLYMKVWLLGFLPLFVYGQGFSPATQARLQTVLDSFQNNPANPYVGGLSVAIDIDKLAFWKGATGYAARNFDENLLPAPEDTPFTTENLIRTYSITKTFTAALILELVHENKLKLSDRVEKYFPLSELNPELDNSVTIHQLLIHRSGFSDFVTDPLFFNALAVDPTKPWTPEEVVKYVRQVYPPDSIPLYTTSEYVILGAIAEKVTGQSMAQLYRTRFFEPLGLKSMYFPLEEPDRVGLADPHDTLSLLGPTFPPIYANISFFPFNGIVSAAFSGGAIVSNVEDVARWGTALFTGRATSKFTLHRMLNSIPDVPDEVNDYLGYGIWTNTKINDTDYFVMHRGVGPGYRSLLFHQPDKKITVAILSNYGGADVYAVARAIYNAIPDFTCGRNDNKIQVCIYGFNLCLPDKLAAQIIDYGGYVGACDNCQEDIPYSIARKDVLQESKWPNTEEIIYTISPNPISEKSIVSFSVERTTIARLEIYSMQGIMVAQLFNGEAYTGKIYQAEFDGRRLSPGMYISRLTTQAGVRTQKLIISR